MRRRRKLRKVYCVLVEGETEKYYIDALRKAERCPIKIKPSIVHQISLKDVKKYIKRYANEEYDKIFWVVDMDTYQDEKEEFCKIRQQISGDAEILVNCPCFEVWLLLHFEEVNREIHNCGTVINELKGYELMRNYDKTSGFYQRNNIYQKLKPYLNTAIVRAKKLDQNTVSTKAQIYKLVEEVIKLSSKR